MGGGPNLPAFAYLPAGRATIALRVPAESRQDTITRATFRPTEPALGGEGDDRSVPSYPAGRVLSLVPLFPGDETRGYGPGVHNASFRVGGPPFARRAELVRGENFCTFFDLCRTYGPREASS